MPRIEGAIEIARQVPEVFAFVADPRNDPAWCERVQWCRQVKGNRIAVGARYEAWHRPAGYPRAHVRSIETLECEPPSRIRWRQDDHLGSFDITYLLAPTATGTMLTQRDEIGWRLGLMRPIGRRIVARHIDEQHEALRRVLEAGSPRSAERK